MTIILLCQQCNAELTVRHKFGAIYEVEPCECGSKCDGYRPRDITLDPAVARDLNRRVADRIALGPDADEAQTLHVWRRK
jgi:hypothetical protein